LGIVKTRQIVVDQGRAMQQLDRCSRCLAQRRVVLTTRLGDGQTQLRSDARTARKHGMVYRSRKFGRAVCALSGSKRHGENLFDAGDGFHVLVSMGSNGLPIK
jgi:hypothetical protein